MKAAGWIAVIASGIVSVMSVALPYIDNRLNVMIVGGALFVLGDIILLINEGRRTE